MSKKSDNLKQCSNCEKWRKTSIRGLCWTCNENLKESVKIFLRPGTAKITLRPEVKARIAELAVQSLCRPSDFVSEIVEVWLVTKRPGGINYREQGEEKDTATTAP